MDKKEAIEFLTDRMHTSATDEVAGYLDRISRLVNKRKKEIVFLENQEGSDIYFLLSGNIKLYKTNEEGKEAVIHFVEPGEFFAEILLFLHNRYPVSAVAIKDSSMLAIDAIKMFKLIKENPDFAMKLISVFAHRLNYLVNTIKNLSIMDAKKKFLNYLSNIKKEDNKIYLTIPKQDIALLLGIAPETFSRVLKQLSSEGFIRINGKEITLLKSIEE